MTEYTSTTGICPTCHKPKYYIGDVPEGGFTQGMEPWCTCGVPNKATRHMSVGWICPKCGVAVNPDKTTCPCSRLF